MRKFLNTLPQNIIACFENNNWIWHIIAILLTIVIVTTNTDWNYFTHTRSDILSYIFSPAKVLGALVPIFLPLYLIVGGFYTKQKIKEILGWAILQAVVIGSFISSFYKFFTGRIQPNLQNITNNISWDFQFGFFRHGIFWGWPSSHTTIAFAMAITLIYLFPKNKVVKILSLIYAFYIGIGVSFSIHWFSDFIAGAIIGTITGIVVARSYKKTLEAVVN